MRAVSFLKACPPYNAGEVAGFPEAEAARLVARGTARYLVGPAEAVAQEAPARAPAPAPERPPADDADVSQAEAVGASERGRRRR